MRTRLFDAALLALLASSNLAAGNTAWQLLDDGDPARMVSQMVYDSGRDRAVLLANETWELVGEDWVRTFLDYPPQASGGGGRCFAHDSTRGVTVALSSPFGSGSAETWEYDGVSWTQRFPVNSPIARQECSMVYDSDNQVVILFGGHMPGTTSGLNDTWEWDGVDWTQANPNMIPGARGKHGLAYDSARQRVVLFGGQHGGTTYGDTWEYDGRKWRQKSPSTPPPARWGPGLAYDAVRQKTVLFGGARNQDFGDTWEWDGTGWTEEFPAQSPAPRHLFGMVYHAGRNGVILEGGHRNNGDFNDTWAYDGTNWQQIAISGIPAVRNGFAMAYDPLLDATVLYGGNVPDTWHFSGTAWSLQGEAGVPSARRDFGLAFDPDGSILIGFSGVDQITVVSDVHEYDGTPNQWTSAPTSGPDPRHNHGWVSAPPFGGILMFGGRACCNPGPTFYLADDTWTLEGMVWRLHGPLNSPAPRHFHGLAFDSARSRAVLYGGLLTTSSNPSAETWEYDGQDWQLIDSNSPPGARGGQGLSLVFDEARGVTVLYGDGPEAEGVTWEFDGTSWVAQPTSFQPDTHRCGNPMAYDPKREVVLLFGGAYCVAGNGDFNDTWAYGDDPDGDGIVGGLDNCRQTPNADQANGDGDPAGDACDCAPADGGSFGQPQEVQDLQADGAVSTMLTWEDQAPLVGSGVVYDLVSGSLDDLASAGGFGGASCLAAGLTTPEYTDNRMPPAADGFYHLARSRNACGDGTYGPGRSPLDAMSPCP